MSTKANNTSNKYKNAQTYKLEFDLTRKKLRNIPYIKIKDCLHLTKVDNAAKRQKKKRLFVPPSLKVVNAAFQTTSVILSPSKTEISSQMHKNISSLAENFAPHFKISPLKIDFRNWDTTQCHIYFSSTFKVHSFASQNSKQFK